MIYPFRIILNISSFIWLVFCLVLTWQNGQQTAHVSQWLDTMILNVLDEFGIYPNEQELDAALRLWAHFVLFSIFGLLFWGGTGASPLNRTTVQTRLILAAIPLALALVAEIPKEWIDGRHLTWAEAWLNVCGAACGMAGAQLIASLHRNLKRNGNDQG